MSDSRPAARNRTAARPRGVRRALRLASWLIVVPTLAFFSFTVVAGAETFGTPDYQTAAQQIASSTSTPLVTVTSDAGKSKVVCTVTASQLVKISAVYRTTRIGAGSYSIVAVYGATASGLRSFLGTSGLTCTLVQVKSVFYLPFDAHGS